MGVMLGEGVTKTNKNFLTYENFLLCVYEETLVKGLSHLIVLGGCS